MAAPLGELARRPVKLFTMQFCQQIKLFGKSNNTGLYFCAHLRRTIHHAMKNRPFDVCHRPKTTRESLFHTRQPHSHCQTLHKQCQTQSGIIPIKDTRHSFTAGISCRTYCRFARLSGHTDTARSGLVLGIETSCDDTGAAVVDHSGRVLGEALNSQTRIHVEMGGIIPHVARDLHRQNIEKVVQAALQDAGVSLQDVDAIACTVKPGLVLSLDVGTKYAKKLVRESGKPFIPIHHMEAHALTARMIEPVDFPFLVLLISGGHCLLAVARDVDDFLLLGTSLDEAPGDAFDKTARKLKLKNLAECSGLSGGAAVEKLARDGDPLAYPLTPVMTRYANCDFSFSGIKEAIRKIIETEELKHGVGPVDVVPGVADVCATMQYWVLHHLARRLQRALLFCELRDLLPRGKKTLVVSGGVGSNQFIRAGLQTLCSHYDCDVVCPPPRLCTDNGIMIAWNGMEKWKIGRGISPDPEAVEIESRSPLGRDIREEVEKSSIKLKRIKLI